MLNNVNVNNNVDVIKNSFIKYVILIDSTNYVKLYINRI